MVPPDGAQSVLALADSPSEAVESVLADLAPERRRAVRSMLQQAVAEGIVTTTVESVSVIAVPLIQDGAVVATIAALVPKPLTDVGPSAQLLLAWSRRLAGLAE